jgi:hypothetical protein
MENNFKLPSELYHKFITVPLDFNTAVVDTIGTGHSFTNHPTSELMTPEGIEYFKQRGMVLDVLTGVFKLSKNFQGPIHSDIRKTSVNVVISGAGAMEWIGDIEGEITYNERKLKHGSIRYPIYTNVTSFKVIDTLLTKTGDFFIARVDVPHRVVNDSDSENRVILAFRIQNGLENLDYDAVVRNFK